MSILSRLCLLWMKSCGSIFSYAALLLLVTITNHHQSMNVRDFLFFVCIWTGLNLVALHSLPIYVCDKQNALEDYHCIFKRSFVVVISYWWLLVWHFFRPIFARLRLVTFTKCPFQGAPRGAATLRRRTVRRWRRSLLVLQENRKFNVKSDTCSFKMNRTRINNYNISYVMRNVYCNIVW